MNSNLFFQAIIKFLAGVLLVGLLIFLPAGTLNFLNGWILMAVLFIPMFIAGIVMMVKNPSLLKKRLSAKEERKEQDLVVKLSGLMFIVAFIVAGLTHRFSWYTLDTGATILGVVIFLLAYALYAEVLRENTFLSRTIEIQDNQTVVDTGLYKIVRHPMYMATVFLFLAIPLILGSIFSFVIMLIYPFLIAKRIQNEEELLEKELKGYKEYKEKVKYRLIPFVW